MQVGIRAQGWRAWRLRRLVGYLPARDAALQARLILRIAAGRAFTRDPAVVVLLQAYAAARGGLGEDARRVAGQPEKGNRCRHCGQYKPDVPASRHVSLQLRQATE